MIGGRGETWNIELPAAALITAHEQPFCKCCKQRLPLTALKPLFLYCVGENCGYDPCRPKDVLDRWDDADQRRSISTYVDEDWRVANGQYLRFPREIVELLLWCFGHPVREHMEHHVLKQAKEWLSLAQFSCVSSRWGSDEERCIRHTEHRLVYARWALKTVKTRLREMKREGKIPTSATVR